MICPKCSHEWNYKGTSSMYVTCPHCYRKISVLETAPTTTQPVHVSDTEMEAIMADREAHIQKMAKDWGPEWQESFWCSTCGAEFRVGYNTAKYCPMCRSDKVAKPPQVIRELFGHSSFIDAESPQAERCHMLLRARREAEAKDRKS